MRIKLRRAVTSCAFLLACCWLGGVETKADPILVTFEERNTDYFTTNGFLLGSYITNSSGVFIGGASINIRPSASAVSPPNAAFGFGNNPASPSRSNIRAQFFVPVEITFLSSTYTSHAIGATDFVSFTVVGTQPGQLESWVANIYDYDGNILDSMTGSADGVVSFSRVMPDIHSFILFVTGSWEGIDNVRFNAAQTPEPATLLLLGAGLAGAAAASRRKRNLLRGGRPRQDADAGAGGCRG